MAQHHGLRIEDNFCRPRRDRQDPAAQGVGRGIVSFREAIWSGRSNPTGHANTFTLFTYTSGAFKREPVRHELGGVAKTRIDVVPAKGRICRQDLLHRITGGQILQNRLHGDPRPPDDGLAVANIRIDDDSGRPWVNQCSRRIRPCQQTRRPPGHRCFPPRSSRGCRPFPAWSPPWGVPAPSIPPPATGARGRPSIAGPNSTTRKTPPSLPRAMPWSGPGLVPGPRVALDFHRGELVRQRPLHHVLLTGADPGLLAEIVIARLGHFTIRSGNQVLGYFESQRRSVVAFEMQPNEAVGR